MTRLTGEFRINLPVYEAIVVCADAIDGLGWRIEGVEANRIVSRADAGSQHAPKVEVVLRGSGQATDVRIIGTDTDAEPLSRDALIAELERVRVAIEASLKGATKAPAQDSPAIARRRRLAIAGIIGLLAIGLGIIGIAIVNDSSDDLNPGRDRGGSKSTGTSQSKTSQAKRGAKSGAKGGKGSAKTPAQQPQEPAPSSALGLGDTADIRDGDEHFELTPTNVAREGSYITLEIEVTGLGNPGYDTTGREFLGTLVGSNGKRYEVQTSGGPGGCELPTIALKNGRTLDGCLSFKVPQGVEADTFRYEPFFLGGDRVEWGLK